VGILVAFVLRCKCFVVKISIYERQRVPIPRLIFFLGKNELFSLSEANVNWRGIPPRLLVVTFEGLWSFLVDHKVDVWIICIHHHFTSLLYYS